jgi:hypothetical protein
MIIIDRFENSTAVLAYQGKTYNIPKEWLPEPAKEGDVILLTAAVDEEETTRRRGEMARKMERLFD